jgi:hypothetical protein
MVWNGFICLRIAISGKICEYGNESSDYTEGGEFFDKLCDYRLLKEAQLQEIGFTWSVRGTRGRMDSLERPTSWRPLQWAAHGF